MNEDDRKSRLLPLFAQIGEPVEKEEDDVEEDFKRGGKK